MAEAQVLTQKQLRDCGLFAQLSDEGCERLLDRHRCGSHAAEQVFVMEQDWGESLFVLLSGIAKVRSYTAEGEEVVMSLLGSGEVFGEMAALDGSPRSADVVALTPVRVARLRAAPFTALLMEDPGLALALARLEAMRLRDLNQRFAVGASDATTRLLAALAYLARKSSSANAVQAVIPPLAQRELAVLAGLARETASRTLSKLRSRGVVVDEKDGLRLADLQPLIKRGLMPAG